MMSYNYPEGTISYISVLIKKKKTSMTRVPVGESRHYLGHFGLKKGKSDCYRGVGLPFADSEKIQLYFQKAFLIKLN